MDIQSLNSAFSALTTQRPQNVPPAIAVSGDQAVEATGPDSFSRAVSTGQIDSVSREKLNSAVEATKSFVGTVNSSLEFSIDEDTDKTVVKIVDKETKELIRQIPSEEMLSIAKALDTIKGLLFRQKA